MKQKQYIKAGLAGLLGAGLFAMPLVAEAAPVYELGEVVVTATRTLKDIQEVPSAVHVITAEDIQQKNVKSLRQVISQLPGMTMDKRAEGLDSDSITMRGMGTDNILVLVDGVPMNSTYNNNVNINDIPVSNVERIEVLRGAASSIYGGHAVAGVINITTKKRTGEGVHYGVQASYGTHNTWHRALSMESTKGAASIGFGWEQKKSDGYRGFYRAARKDKNAKKADYEADLPRLSDGSYVYGGRGEKAWTHDGLHLSLNYRLDKKKDLTYKFSHTEYTYSYKNPFSFVKDKDGNMVFSGYVKNQTGDIISLPTGRFYGYEGGADKDRQSLTYQDNENQAHVLFFYSKDNYNGFSSASIPKKYTKVDWEGEGDYSVHPEKVYGFDAEKAWTFDDHTLLLGVNYKKEFMYQDRYGLAKWKDWSTKTFRYAYDSGNMQNTALYMQDEWKFGKDMTAYLGLRYDRFTKGAGHFVKMGKKGYDHKSQEQTYHELSPKVALAFEGDHGTHYYLSFGHSFNPPPMSQVYRYGGGGMGSVIPNPDLDPERSNTWEIGMKRYLDKDTQIGINGYYIETKDKIAYTHFYQKPGDKPDAPRTKEVQYKQYINYSEAKTKGIELDVSTKFTDELSGYFNIAWQRGWASGAAIPKTNRTESYRNERIYGIPEYIMHSGLSYEKDKWNLLLDCEYVSAQMDPEEPTGEYGAYDAYFLVNLGMNYQITEGCTLQVGIDNLFDKKYFASEATDGRTYTVGLRYRM